MENKKTQKANLEKGKSFGFMMGIIVALAILFTGFEWGSNDLKVTTDNGFHNFNDDTEEILITRPEPPTPPKPEEIKTPEILVEVDNETDVEDYEIASTDDNSNTKQTEIFENPVVEKKEVIDDVIYFSVENMPKFPGGDEALLRWIAEHVNYPTTAAENGIEGRVTCSFVVNTDGSICDVTVLRSIDPSLDKEAMRVIKSMPKWKPGMQQGKAVRVKFTVPVRFRLQK